MWSWRQRDSHLVPRLSLYYEEGSKQLQHLAINALRELLTVSHLRDGISSVGKALEMKVIPYTLQTARPWLYLNHTVQKDSREVLGTSFRFGPTSEILENIQYGGSSVVKTDSQRSRFIAREAWFTVLLTKFAFIVTFAEFLDLYSKQSFYKCLINLSCPAGRYYRRK